MRPLWSLATPFVSEQLQRHLAGSVEVLFLLTFLLRLAFKSSNVSATHAGQEEGQEEQMYPFLHDVVVQTEGSGGCRVTVRLGETRDASAKERACLSQPSSALQLAGLVTSIHTTSRPPPILVALLQ